MSRLRESIFLSVGCFPRELAGIVGDYAKPLPVKFRFEKHGCESEGWTVGEQKGNSQLQGTGQDSFVALGIPFTWKVRICGLHWSVGVTSRDGMSLSFHSDGSLSDLIQMQEWAGLYKPFDRLKHITRLSKISFGKVSFDIRIITQDHHVTFVVTQITIDKNPESISYPHALKIQEAIDGIVGNSQTIDCDNSVLHTSFPSVSTSFGHVQSVPDAD